MITTGTWEVFMRGWASAVLAGVLLAGLNPVQADGPPPGTVVSPQTLPALQQSLQMFQKLADSTAAQTTQSLSGAQDLDYVGWIVSAIGIASSSDTQVVSQLTQIDEQITGIQQTVTVIDGQIAQVSQMLSSLTAQLVKENCAEQSAQMTAALTTVQNAQMQYETYLGQAAGQVAGTPGQVAPSWPELVDAAEDVVSGPDNLRIAARTIDNVLTGTSDDGAIPACVQAMVTYAGNTVFGWEQAYYSQVYLYLSYWYQIQVQALNLYVEAQHVLALEASGRPPSSYDINSPQSICAPPLANGDMVTACNNAAEAVALVAANISDQFMAGGAPYSWGTGGQVNAINPSSGRAAAWLMDINDFQVNGCRLPLVSTPGTCGGSVGTGPAFNDTEWGDFSWGMYSGWVPATTAQWQALGLQSYTNQPVWQAMASIGMGDTQRWGPQGGLSGLIVYTGETASSTMMDFLETPSTLTGQCFLDTSNTISGDTAGGESAGFWATPACDGVPGAGAIAAFVTNGNFPSSGPGGQYLNWPNGSSAAGWDSVPARTAPLNYSNPAFYTAAFIPGQQNWWVTTAPGWLTAVSGTNYQPTPEYRWPVLPLSDSMCTAKNSAGQMMSHTNGGGAFTMCGQDMLGWIGAQLPTVSTPAAPQAVAVAPALRSAVVSWRPGSVRQKVDGYRIRVKYGKGRWQTAVTDTSAQSAVAAKAERRLHYQVPIRRSGFYRFKVVSLIKDRRSRPSQPSRREYVSAERHPYRYYTFERAGTVRVAKAFADGRVYWAGRQRTGFGIRRHAVVKGHSAVTRYRWSGIWRQRVTGTWRTLRWSGWSREQGPARTRKDMPLPHVRLPKN